jgi:hypothetical protein
MRSRNTTQISENTLRIMAGVRDYAQGVVRRQQVTPNIKTSSINVAEVTNIPFNAAIETGQFSYVGMGLYKQASTDTDVGRIWVKKEFENPSTGEREEWLVAYTTDEDEIARQIVNSHLKEIEPKNIQKTAQAETEVDIPIAPGIKSKSINIDEKGGEAGTGTVTIEFTDPTTAWDFYQNQVGTQPMGATQPAMEIAPPEPEDMTEPLAYQAQPEAAEPAPATSPPPPPPPPAAARLKPSVFKKHGQQYVTVLEQRFSSDKPNRYSFVNEQGQVVPLKWVQAYRVGQVFERPDTGEAAKVLGYGKIKFADLDSIVDSIVKTATAPPGMEDVVKDLKKDPDVDNPWALAWHTHNKKKDKKESSLNKEAIERDLMYSINPEAWIDRARQLSEHSDPEGAAIDLATEMQDAGEPFPYETLLEEARNLIFDVMEQSRFDEFDAYANKKETSTMDITASSMRLAKTVIASYKDIQQNPEGYKGVSPTDGIPEGFGYRPISQTSSLNKGDVIGNPDNMDLFIVKEANDYGVVVDMDGEEVFASYADLRDDGIQKFAQDISDEIPPMAWTTEDDVNIPEGAGPALPPQEELQEESDVLYDSEEDEGPQVQTLINPDDKSVTVKWLDSEEQQALDEAVKERTQELKTQQQVPAPPQQGFQPGEFDETDVPIEF